MPPALLVVQGYGESQPIGDNETEQGRFQKQRVELQSLKPVQ